VSATFATGAAFVFALVAYETLYKKDGLFHHGPFLPNRNFSIACSSVVFEGVAFFGITAYFSFEVATFYERDAMLVVVCFSLLFITAASTMLLAGWYTAHDRRVRWITVAAYAVLAAFFIGMATAGRGSDRAVWGYAVLPGMPFGVISTTLITIAQLSTPPALISIASGIFIAVRFFGSTVGLAVRYNAVLNDVMADVGRVAAEVVVPQGLAEERVTSLVVALTKHNATALESIPGITPEIIASGNTRSWIPSSWPSAMFGYLGPVL
jgi:hypothetical protein